MKVGRLIWLIVAFLALPLALYAQDATLSGTVKDNTGGVLPGVTVTAVNQDSGISFQSVSDEHGLYRMPVRAGTFKITAELSGFTTQTRMDVEMLLGKAVTLDFNMTVSGVQETVQVTGEAPLIDTSTSTIATNIDPRQMQDIPLNGRNWMDLTMLSAGSRSNASSEVPEDRQGYFQTVVDGQSVTLTVCCSQNQPRYSRDSIAEFQLMTNRFDATQGRTMGQMVNAITKSGTNQFTGTFGGYFRSDKWNAADFIQKKVLPYSDQQISGTIGGPIVKDRVHFFGNWEYERNPQTFTFGGPGSPFASYAGPADLNLNLPANYQLDMGGAKVDTQINPKNRFSVRWSHYKNLQPISGGGGATSHPSTASANNRFVDQYFGDYTSVISNNTVNEIKGGLNANYYTLEPLAGWGTTGSMRPPGTAPILVGVTSGREITGGTPRIAFSGYTIGSPGNNPQRTGEHNFQFRDDFSTAFQAAGRHDVKMGADVIKYTMSQGWCNNCDGGYTSSSKPPANLPDLIPVWNDASTWNFAAMSPLFQSYNVAIGNMSYSVHRQIYASWFQDDWKINGKLTANMGVRYDLDHGAQGEFIKFLPWLTGKRPTDKNDFAPRLGFAYELSDKQVIRGGWGLFFTELEDDALHQSYVLTQQMNVQVLNDGRPDFGGNPWNGATPSYETLLANACDVKGLPANSKPGTGADQCFPRSIPNGSEVPAGAHDTSYSHMASIGTQREFTADMALDTNFVFTGGRKEERRFNLNDVINPATGVYYPTAGANFNNSVLPFPSWGPVAGEIMSGRSNYYGWENTFTKRFSHHWQANATYTLSWFKDDGGIAAMSAPYVASVDITKPISTTLTPYTGTVMPDMGPLYQLASTDQRHKATFNGIWDMGKGVQLSGLYFYGSGQRYGTTWGSDLRNLNNAPSYSILTPAGTTAASLGTACGCAVKGIVDANGEFLLDRAQLVGKPIHRVDMRLQKRISLGGKRSIDGMLEVFNVFNHANYGSYVTTFSNAANYGHPSFNAATAYAPRIMQLGFHMAF